MSETNGVAQLSETEARELVNTVAFLQERLAELEDATDGWQQVGGEGEREFSREFLRKITALSRVMYLKNTLIKRAVHIHPTVSELLPTTLWSLKPL